MSLEIDLIARIIVALAPKEVVEAHLEQRGRRGISRNVPANARALAIGPHHHGHGIPANDAFNASLDFAITGIEWLLANRNGVDIGGVGCKGKLDPAVVSQVGELSQQIADAFGPFAFENILERLQPLGRFVGVHILRRANRVRSHGRYLLLKRTALQLIRPRPPGLAPPNRSCTRARSARAHLLTIIRIRAKLVKVNALHHFT